MNENPMISNSIFGVNIKFRNVEQMVAEASKESGPIYQADFAFTCYYELQEGRTETIKGSKKQVIKPGVILPWAVMLGLHEMNNQRVEPLEAMTANSARDLTHQYFAKHPDKYFHPIITQAIAQTFEKPQTSSDGIVWDEFETKGQVYLLNPQ
ncbi:MAG: hypothetical protein V1837_00515 [Candidatus Woesearchaeota archaeon]